MTEAAADSLPGRAADPLTEALLYWYMALTPLWWATGTLLPLGVLGAVVLFLRRLPREPGLALLVGLWFLVGLVQFAAAVVNYVFAGETGINLLHSAVSPGITGWVLIGVCIGIGGQAGLATPRMARAIGFQALWILVLTAISVVAAYGFGMESLAVPSPLALLLPGDIPLVRYHLTMTFFLHDELLDDRALRLSLFFPWPTALSLAGATALLLGLCAEGPRRWRVAAILGGAAGVWFGYSRSVALSLVLAVGAIALLRLPRPARFATVLLAGLLANAAVVAGWDPISAVQAAHETFTSMRAGSSFARQLLYDITWTHFLERPIFGYGAYSGPVARWLPVPLGSHSSFYGVLYLGGVATFGMLCLAFAATLLAVALRLGDRRREAPAALAMLLTIGVVGFGENISSIAPSLLASFIWLGGVLRPPEEPAA